MDVVKYVVSNGEEKTILIEKEIGSGGYGTVYKGILDGVGYVAVKVQKLNRKVFKSLITEVEIRSALGSLPDYAVPVERVIFHPIFFKPGVKLPESEFISISDSIPKDKAISIYPFAGDLDLFEIVQAHYKARTPISTEVLLQYTKETILGLKKLHEKGIAHRDIKPENIMLGNGKLRYIDFGFACFYPKCEGRMGSPYYIAPEIYDETYPISNWAKTDVFSLGNTLFFMLTLGRNVIDVEVDDPSIDINAELKAAVLNNTIEDLRDHIYDRIETYLQPNLSALIPLLKGMTYPDESGRWSVDDCITWIQNNL